MIKMFFIFCFLFLAKTSASADLDISNAKKIALMTESYEHALSICEELKRSKRELPSADLETLRKINKTDFSAFIKNKSIAADEVCLIENGAPTLMAIKSLRDSLKGSDKLIMDGFLELISVSGAEDDFLGYVSIDKNIKKTLDSISYFNKPFSIIYIADLVAGRIE